MSELVCKWTCGVCGDTYEASGMFAALHIDGWRNVHAVQHGQLPPDGVVFAPDLQETKET